LFFGVGAGGGIHIRALIVKIQENNKKMFVCLFVRFHGRPRQATDVLQAAGLLYRPLWTFQLWPPDARAPTDAFCTLAAEIRTYGRE
jgi:hypothetical protein